MGPTAFLLPEMVSELAGSNVHGLAIAHIDLSVNRGDSAVQILDHPTDNGTQISTVSRIQITILAPIVVTLLPRNQIHN